MYIWGNTKMATSYKQDLQKATFLLNSARKKVIKARQKTNKLEMKEITEKLTDIQRDIIKLGYQVGSIKWDQDNYQNQ